MFIALVECLSMKYNKSIISSRLYLIAVQIKLQLANEYKIKTT